MHNTRLADTTLVCKSNGNDPETTHPAQSEERSITTTQQSKSGSSPSLQTEHTGLPIVGEKLDAEGISPLAKEIIMASCRKGTTNQYRTYLRQWETFCDNKVINYLDPTVDDGIEFLVYLYNENLGYRAINTAR